MKDLPEKVDSTPSNLGPDQLLTPEHALFVTSEAVLFSRGLWIPLPGTSPVPTNSTEGPDVSTGPPHTCAPGRGGGPTRPGMLSSIQMFSCLEILSGLNKNYSKWYFSGSAHLCLHMATFSVPSPSPPKIPTIGFKTHLMLSEFSQAEKDNYHLICLIYGT